MMNIRRLTAALVATGAVALGAGTTVFASSASHGDTPNPHQHRCVTTGKGHHCVQDPTPSPKPHPTHTPKPTHTPRATPTPRPDPTHTPRPTPSPRPSHTPRPTPSPRPHPTFTFPARPTHTPAP